MAVTINGDTGVDKVVDNTITTDDIQDGAITAAKIASGAVSGYDTPTTSTGYFALPSGTTAQRPVSPATGDTRYNTTLGLSLIHI